RSASVGRTGSRRRRQGVAAAGGSGRRGGGAEVGGEAAQPAIMSSEASGALRIQRLVGVMGAPRPGLGARGGALHGQGLSMVGFKAKVRGGGGGLLQPPRGGVGFGDRGPRLGGGHAPAGAVKGVPAEPQRLAGERENDHAGEDERRPRNRPGEAE